MTVSCRATVEPLRTSRAEDRAIADHPLILVAGAGGFIGGHLVARPAARRAYRIAAPWTSSRSTEWYQLFDDVENLVARPAASRTRAETALPRRCT